MEGRPEQTLNIKSDSYWVKIASAINLMQQKKNDEAISTLLKAKKGDFPDPAASYFFPIHISNRARSGLLVPKQKGLFQITQTTQIC